LILALTLTIGAEISSVTDMAEIEVKPKLYASSCQWHGASTPSARHLTKYAEYTNTNIQAGTLYTHFIIVGMQSDTRDLCGQQGLVSLHQGRCAWRAGGTCCGAAATRRCTHAAQLLHSRCCMVALCRLGRRQAQRWPSSPHP
jgi:hypothetical protein